MNEATPNSAWHNKVLLDSMFCNELIHLEFCIHKIIINTVINTLINLYINEDIGRSLWEPIYK